MEKLRKWLPALFLGLVLILAACGNGESDSGENAEGDSKDAKTESKGTVSIGMNNWAENVAVSNMWKLILEEKGYEVELKQVEKGFLYEALSAGDLDIGMEIWLPHTDKPFYEKYEDEIDWRAEWYEGTELGLVVPTYMEDINTIEDLKNTDAFEKKEIVGIDAGASLMSLTEEAISEYDLDYQLLASSGPTMTTELKNAIEDEEPIVVTLWKPHWAFAEMDLKFLEDTKTVYGESENISYAARKGLEEDNPTVVKWFDNFKMNDQQLGSLMAVINESDSPEEGAQKWIEDHQDVIDEWTKQ
ncbi:glycine betaine ABC transporter substrate-binding protein [Halobacillus yeomjeoni]|uniref:glycine betaine ABC transporter substrate-binding protein n=1 Tax=Halobacillus yeomjeoni TaxID=311194 RepID=UPI001CD4B820|nr:glycine betaine ABC transporter substrate-binding protein [Halobacillus yeomjeoni]MCA0984565.1 glycine betaine ABC transporter substrate-binding protein [Halobacillus yeomjeoni]